MARAFGGECRLEPDEVEFWQATYTGAVTSGQQDAAGVADDAVMSLRRRLGRVEAPASHGNDCAALTLVDGVPALRGFVVQMQQNKADGRAATRTKVGILFDGGSSVADFDFVSGPATDALVELMRKKGFQVGVEVRFVARH